MATDYDTARFQHELYRFCYMNTHDEWVAKAAQCFNFWESRQWRDADKAKLEREGRPALTFNVIRSLVRSMKGIQRALRNDVRFMPSSDATLEDARVRDAVWMHIQQQNQLDFIESDVYQQGLIMGRAYYDVRVTNDDDYRGHVRIRALRPQDVVLDVIEDYDPAKWPRVFTRSYVSNRELRDVFGKDVADRLKNNAMPTWYDSHERFSSLMMGKLPYFRFEADSASEYSRSHLIIDHQYYEHKKKKLFLDAQTGDRREVPETWDDNRISHVLSTTPDLMVIEDMVKTVRWVLTCEDEVLFEADSPYRWFTVVPFFPEFIGGITSGVVEDLIGPQELFNKVTSQELHIINTTANSGWKVRRGGLKNMTPRELESRGATPGFVAEVENIGDIEKIEANGVPQGHDRISFKAEQIMRSISGVSEQGRGFAREDVAGSAILTNQAAQDINFAGYMSNLHRTKQLLAMRVMDAVQTTYTETRVIMINKGSLYRPDMQEVTLNEPTAEGRVLNDVTQGTYSTVLVPAPSRTTLSEADFSLLLNMRERGIGIPDDLLIELSPASNKAQIIEKLVGDSAQREQEAAERDRALADAELEKQRALTEKETSAARLNDARAEKFTVEAATDPDARYAEVEMARIESDREAHEQNLNLKEREAAFNMRHKTRELSVHIAELDQRRKDAENKPQPDKPKR